MKASFENSVDVLVKAYLNDTLEPMSCCACAVGNLVAAANGFTFKGRHRGCSGNLIWDGYQTKQWPTWQQAVRPYCYSDHQENEGKKQIETTGYTIDQLSRIEDVFMFYDDNFNGLMAVVDVLAEIHNVDLSVKEAAKLQFVKA